MNKVLTIVVPVYNTEQYLSKCLDSLIIKDNRELIEVLIIIDGSPDNSLQIATEYSLKYPDLFCVINKENGGHGSCCNVGIQHAKGKYIKFLDSDDWFDTNSLSILVSQLKKSNVDVFFTRSIKELIYENRTVKYGYNFEYDNEIIDIKDLEIKFTSEHPYFFTLADCGFSVELFRKINLKFTEKFSFDDTILYLLPFKAIKQVLFLNIILYHYFIGRPEQSVSQLTSNKYTQMTSEFLRCLSSCNDIDYNNLNVSVQMFINSLTSQLIDSSYYSLFHSSKANQSYFYRELQSLIKKSPLLKNNTSRFHRYFKLLPFTIAKNLFLLRKMIIRSFK